MWLISHHSFSAHQDLRFVKAFPHATFESNALFVLALKATCILESPQKVGPKNAMACRRTSRRASTVVPRRVKLQGQDVAGAEQQANGTGVVVWS
jgi:hypothetical protein